jgi:hypothetical protein
LLQNWRQTWTQKKSFLNSVIFEKGKCWSE